MTTPPGETTFAFGPIEYYALLLMRYQTALRLIELPGDRPYLPYQPDAAIDITPFDTPDQYASAHNSEISPKRQCSDKRVSLSTGS